MFTVLRNSVSDAAVRPPMSEEDRLKIDAAVLDLLAWLDSPLDGSRPEEDGPSDAEALIALRSLAMATGTSVEALLASSDDSRKSG